MNVTQREKLAVAGALVVGTFLPVVAAVVVAAALVGWAAYVHYQATRV